METQKLMKYPPMVETVSTPNEIIGLNNLELFTAYLQICFSSTNAGEFPRKRLEKEIGAENLSGIAETLEELKSKGFSPVSVNHQGKIKWKITTKSPMQLEFEKGMDQLQGKSISELRAIARNGYRKIMENMKVAPVDELELQRERVRNHIL